MSGEEGPQESPDQLSSHHLMREEEQARVHRYVNQFLSPDYDREFIASQIIITAWEKDLPTVSKDYVRKKCITAYHRRQREIKGTEMIAMHQTQQVHSQQEEYNDEIRQRSELVEKLTMGLTPTEKKLITMKYYMGLSLEDMATELSIRREEIQKMLEVAIFKMYQVIKG